MRLLPTQTVAPPINSTRIVAALLALNDYGRYVCRGQRPRIQTYAIIIAATLNTIRHSAVLSHCLTGDETGASAFIWFVALEIPRTRMAPAIAIAAGDSFGLADWELGR